MYTNPKSLPRDMVPKVVVQLHTTEVEKHLALHADAVVEVAAAVAVGSM